MSQDDDVCDHLDDGSLRFGYMIRLRGRIWYRGVVGLVRHEPTSSVPPESADYSESMPHFHVPLVDVDKVRCVIRNIVRDWAAEGQKERDRCYKPILEELVHHFPERSKERRYTKTYFFFIIINILVAMRTCYRDGFWHAAVFGSEQIQKLNLVIKELVKEKDEEKERFNGIIAGLLAEKEKKDKVDKDAMLDRLSQIEAMLTATVRR